VPQGRPKASDQGLLDAGLDLASEQGLAALTVDAVIDRAGTGKGTFYRHFGDRAGFLLAMHTELRRRVWTAATETMADLAPAPTA
jgi:AcrR family transcriptional regulator